MTTTKQKAPTGIEALTTLATTTTTAASKYKPFAATVFIGSQALIDDLQASSFAGNRLVCIGAHDNAEAYQWSRLHSKPVLVLADNTPSDAEVENLCIELVRCGVSSIQAGRLNGQFITSYSQGGK